MSVVVIMFAICLVAFFLARRIVRRSVVYHQRHTVGQRQSRHIPQDVKVAVAVRDGGRCVYCGSTENIQYDHKIPWSRGGAATVKNIQLLCGACNRSKSNKILVGR